ncbi:ketoacyl-synthetase C-terminal extension domain-containing protein, partial [Streptomyces sp. NRRL S-350]|uniref:ketoacyl-synthetase C-terminal extension domain-containing protein n=1 Tax=Streptomyces sp. NRRL S-350 TaxID=1463902 RepID=UPI003B66F6E1
MLTEEQPWPSHDRPRRAGVSSFGVSGTNAHVILEQPPVTEEPEERAGTALPVVPWILSARDEDALRDTAARLADALTDDASPLDIGYSLATSRALLTERAVVLGADPEARHQALKAFANGQTTPDVITGRGGDGTLTMVFSGQGSQRLGMGHDLYTTY